MRLKLRIISLAIAFIFGLCLTLVSLPADSWLRWKLGTIKSELWAVSQIEPSFRSEQTNTLVEDQIIKERLTSSIFPSSNTEDIGNNFYPLGWYDSVDNLATPDQIAPEGIDFVIPYTGESDAKEVKAYLDRAAAAGIKVMVEIPRLEVRRDHRWLITQFVKALKNHPAVHGWYLFDEPEFIQMSPAILERVYKAIKLEDPKHTVAIAFGKLDRAEEYLAALDTLIFFRYPCFDDSPQCRFEDGSFSELASEASTISQGEDNFWMVLQGYGEDRFGKPRHNRRLPSYEEERYMIYSAVLAKVNGLIFWAHYISQQQWIDTVLTPLVRELREYLPVIANTQGVVPQAIASQEGIEARLFRHPQTSNLLLVAINHSPQSVASDITLQPRVRVNSALVAAEDRTVPMQQGKLSDAFEPFSVHVYQLQSN